MFFTFNPKEPEISTGHVAELESSSNSPPAATAFIHFDNILVLDVVCVVVNKKTSCNFNANDS